MIIEEKYYRRLNITSGDLRISVTDACNMRCVYCHNEGQGVAKRCSLSVDQIRAVVSTAKRYGLSKVRLTGGEPLVHPEIESIVDMIANDLEVDNLGINTNAYAGNRLVNLCEGGLLSQVVVGMDYFGGAFSKESSVGPSPAQVRETVLALKDLGCNVQIAAVYDRNQADLFAMADWCLEHGILFKILEKTIGYATGGSQEYEALIGSIAERFSLKVGMTADLEELYLFDDARGKILFFQSHCNRGECAICRNLHLRVTSRGEAKPCLMRDDTTFELFGEDMDLAYRRAIANMGNGPGGDVL